MADLYEQLRDAIDGGSESMTHEDALRWINDAQFAMSITTPPSATNGTGENKSVSWLIAEWTRQADESEQLAKRLGESNPVHNELLRDAAQYRQSIFQIRHVTATPPAVTEGQAVDFVAKNHDGWWTIQTMCGPQPRAYAIRKDSGEVIALPDARCPFVEFPAKAEVPPEFAEALTYHVATTYEEPPAELFGGLSWEAVMRDLRDLHRAIEEHEAAWTHGERLGALITALTCLSARQAGGE